ncbi:peripheral inner membrane phage-shock protein [Leminorella richardii]|uniref:Peripheral inner membrane phage-shock protein n=1 Tax=Leminorella richardii TaxID=158841 RepID=A0A2X4XM40_9GAMM|nr:phage shock protein D [Leminorella richardii]SQI40995.1 peripheral inner membrane phage-shock protein [Leminorella richardii]
MTHTFKRQAVVQALAGILFFLGKSYGPAFVLSFLLKRKMWRPARAALVLFGEPLLRKGMSLAARRMKKASNETTEE